MFGWMSRSASALAALALLLPLTAGTTGCASIEVTRTTQTSGRFVSKATSFMILWYDVPERALDVARGNAADARLTNVKVRKAYEKPHFGWFDWIYLVLGVRGATVEGTWGFTGEENR
jgi:hypothetical protein